MKFTAGRKYKMVYRKTYIKLLIVTVNDYIEWNVLYYPSMPKCACINQINNCSVLYFDFAKCASVVVH